MGYKYVLFHRHVRAQSRADSSDERGLAVLSKDYLTVPVDEISGIESLLTMLGSKIVYASGDFAQLEE